MSEPSEESRTRSRIRPVKERVEDDLVAQPGVVGVDIAEKETEGRRTGELSIVVFVEKKRPMEDVPADQQVPEQIEGVPTDVQELTIELQPGAMAMLAGEEPLVDPAVYPTMAGGISMGPQRSVFLSPPDVPAPGNYIFVGTLGAMVRDRTSGATMALTNFHVACVNNSWSVGDIMVQPSRVDDDANDDQFGTLTRAQLTDEVDGAVATLDAGQAWDPSVTGVGGVTGTAVATVGMAVQKRGRTTEHTFGEVVSTDFTLSVDYGSDVGLRTFHHQLRITPDTSRNPRFSDRGDSGSVVLDLSRKVVGLLFAGSTDGSFTFANPIQSALDALDVDIITAPSIVLTKPSIICPPTKLSVLCGDGLISRFVICPTKSLLCPSKISICPTRTSIFCPTRLPVLCDRPTRLPVCDVEHEWPGEGPGPGPFAEGEVAPAEMEAYWAGYLTALEEAVEAESAGDDGGDEDPGDGDDPGEGKPGEDGRA